MKKYLFILLLLLISSPFLYKLYIRSQIIPSKITIPAEFNGGKEVTLKVYSLSESVYSHKEAAAREAYWADLKKQIRAKMVQCPEGSDDNCQEITLSGHCFAEKVLLKPKDKYLADLYNKVWEANQAEFPSIPACPKSR